MASDCLICREHDLDVPTPGGHLVADESVVGFHLPPWPPPAEDVFLGYLMVTSRRHVPDLASLSDVEAGQVGIITARLSRALRTLGAERVYLAVTGHSVAHFHLHLVPRWPGTPPEVPWTQVDVWQGARRGSFEEAAQVAQEVRASLGSHL